MFKPMKMVKFLLKVIIFKKLQKVLSTYWYDPSLELRRTIGGTAWTLETKLDYYMPLTNGRSVGFTVGFGDPASGASYYEANFSAGRDSGYSVNTSFSTSLSGFNSATKASISALGVSANSSTVLARPRARSISAPAASGAA